MKDFFTKNIGLKLLSVLLALLLWLTVMNVEDPAVTVTISDVPVQIVNDEVITSRGYRYIIESGEKIDIRVKGRRSVVDRITADDFVATADFSSFSSMKMVPIEIVCTDEHAQELTCTPKTDSMAIILEDESSVSKSIRIDREGSVKEGYYLYDFSTDTSLVTVNGAESQVAAVKDVVAVISLDGMKDTDDIVVSLYAENEDGERIDAKKITLTPETVTVHLTINPIKAIPLVVRTTGDPAQHYYIGEIEYAPKTVQVTADPIVLDRLMALDIAVPIDDADTDIEKQINLDEYIDEHYDNTGLKIVDQNKTMGIKIPVIKKSEMSLDVKPENVDVRGNDPQYQYTMTSGWLSKVLVRGKEEELANIEVSDFNLYIDVTGMTVGSYPIDLKSDYSGDLEIEPGRVNIAISEIVNVPETSAEIVEQ